MTIRTILAPLRGGERLERAPHAALALARALGAHVELLHVSADPRDAIPLVGDAVVSSTVIDEIVEKAAEDAKARLDRARARFRGFAGTAGVRHIETRPTAAEVAEAAPSLSWRHITGREDEIVGTRGRVFDLIVTDRPSEDDDGQPEATLESVLLNSGRPVLVAPPEEVNTIGTRIAIAWNGSAAAARAVTAAMPLLERAGSVLVLCGQSTHRTEPLPEDLAATLAWHGIGASVSYFDSGTGQVGTSLLAEARHLHADLLVMGGYGHSHLREMIFGGATVEAIFAAELPLLMVH